MVTLSQTRLVKQTGSAWLIFASDERLLLPPGKDPLTRRLTRMLQKCPKSATQAGRATVLPTWEVLPTEHVIVTGLGSLKNLHTGRILEAAGTAARAARQAGITKISVAASTLEDLPDMPIDAALQAVSIGCATGSYEFRKKASGKRRGAKTVSLTITDTGKAGAAAKKAVREANGIAEVLDDVRDIGNLPGNECTPATLTTACRALARKYGLSCSILDKKQLRQKKCHAHLSVAQGSGGDARLIVLKHRGTRQKSKPIVLIGKTITFDTGGVSLKRGSRMEWMKFDKCGGMAVLAATLICAKLKVKTPVIGMLPAAENMPDGRATRPGDVVGSHSGKTIEIINTDAEGRLVLADALSLSASHRPRAIVDLATLTGAAVIALGSHAAPIMGTDDSLVAALSAAGERTGERLWHLPLYPEYAKGLSSPFADLRNIGTGGAGCIVAGSFLQQFVPKGTPWAHIDIAGTAWEEKSRPHCSPGVTLFGARLLYDWLKAQ